MKDKLVLIEAWARDGVIDENIAKKLGIAYSTFNLYKTKYSELLDALKKGKEVVDFEVENALLKRAMGYDYVEETVEKLVGGGEKYKAVTKHMPGDTVAQIFWLKNRRPDKWRDKREDFTEQEANVTINIKGATDGD